MKTYKILLLVIAIVGLAGLFIALRPEPQDSSSATTRVAPDKGPTVRKQDFELELTDGEVSQGQTKLKVRKGERVVVSVISDKADELHLHGYDKAVDLIPGKVVRMEFTADTAGSFEAETHSNKRKIFALEVRP